MQRIAVIDPATNQISVFKKEFNVIRFDDFTEDVITFFDDPLNKNKKIIFKISAETIYENRTLR